MNNIGYDEVVRMVAAGLSADDLFRDEKIEGASIAISVMYGVSYMAVEVSLTKAIREVHGW
jgi:hypothetical protein